MSIQFILGGSGTGKTTQLLREINDNLNSNAPMYYLVPEQFSLQAERLLLDGPVATQVQVLSFNRLAYRLFSALGFPSGKHADDLGKQMLLYKVLSETAEELKFYRHTADKHGFVTELSATITELNHYCINPADLTDRADGAPPSLAAKLRDTAIILQKYREAVSGNYLLADEMPTLLCNKLEETQNQPLPLLDGALFWLDGFSGFTPQERRVLGHIMKRAAKITVAITINDEISPAPRETIAKLEEAAINANTEILPHKYLKENLRHAKALPSIEIISTSDKYAAVYTAAQKITQLVENGYNFRDIAILCGNKNTYEKILQTIFDRMKIPMFVDTQIDIFSHPLTELIRAALSAVIFNHDKTSVFRFFKTGLTGTPQHIIDITENYALANGIHSYRWNYPFKCETAEIGRQNLLAALAPLKKSRATVTEHARRVFEMLEILQIPQTLQTLFNKYMEENDPATARFYAQIWPKLCEVFDKLAEILGNEKMPLKDFAATLDAGLMQVGLGRIPPTVNQVILGDITRSRYPRIKAMIALGANDGELPPPPPQSGLFTEYERGILSNLELAPNNHQRISETNYNLYCALSQPSEKLIFIYASHNLQGVPLRPAPVIKHLRGMFPALPIQTAPSITEGRAEESLFFAPVTFAKQQRDTLHTAATRLEAFARCPFSYFMRYDLKANPRKLYEVLPTDLGSIFHEVVEQFTKKIALNEIEPKAITQTKAAQIVNTIINQMQEKLQNTAILSTERNRHILEKVRRAAAVSCWAICGQMGDFRPLPGEQELTHTLKNAVIHGKADRIDILPAGDAEYLRIFDYKSGSTKFSISDALAGVQLQLMLYMNAALKSRTTPETKPLPSGVFYFNLYDPIIDTDIILPDELREANILKAFKPTGIEIAEKTTGSKMDLQAFNTFSRDIEQTAINLAQQLNNGVITPKPYAQGEKSPCRNCAYSGVCQNN